MHTQPPQHFESIETRQHDVENECVELLLKRDFKPLWSVMGE